ncbi:hypothetical protein [Burkholderia cenocepacia]|uniref:hypothetical protein n=1 Tax=Burkholderia cenocepacia TaxID=95486 RepID=UPI001CF5C5F9|nr:hypothetical protein [Burkholderia cenocepacia]MCA8237716.1 hypothetical protein [Burkholderia cenocepacia]
MFTARQVLIAWIDRHDRPEPTVDNGDDTLTVASAYSFDGAVRVQRAVIPATMVAARALLGY